MSEFFGLLQDIFMMKKADSDMKVGLTQFKQIEAKPIVKDVSIRNKDVKLSDLMRRAG